MLTVAPKSIITHVSTHNYSKISYIYKSASTQDTTLPVPIRTGFIYLFTINFMFLDGAGDVGINCVRISLRYTGQNVSVEPTFTNSTGCTRYSSFGITIAYSTSSSNFNIIVTDLCRCVKMIVHVDAQIYYSC